MALDIETARAYGRRILAGVSRYLVTHRNWSIYVEQHEIGSGIQQLLNRWEGDGIITRQATPQCIELILQKNLAVVDLSNFDPHLGIPRINSSDRAIGDLAAQHFIERGFRNFACHGYESQYWSTQRRLAFEDSVSSAGHSCAVLERSLKTRAKLWDRDQQRLAEWIAELPKPLAVFATNDLLGQHVLEVCAAGGHSVPEEVAVVGVDDDEILCKLSNPPLSSIDPNAERIGYEAASLLDRLMKKHASEDDALVEVPPMGVVTRQSSDILAVPDPDFSAAMKFIREHACEGISVDDVLRHVAMSRSSLERRFRAHLNRSPQSEIRNVQVKRCMELLCDTDLPLRKIAHLAGFKHLEYMSVVFKRETGETPGRYRTLHQR